MIASISLFSGLLFVNSVVVLCIGIYSLSRKILPGAIYFAVLMFVVAWWSFLSAHEMVVYGATAKLLANQLLYVGKSLVGVVWFLFAISFSGYPKKSIEFLRVLLLFVPVYVLFLIFTNSALNMFWISTLPVNSADPYSPLNYVNNWGFYLNVAYQYFFIVLGAIVLIIHGMKSERKVQFQVFSTILALVAPMIANILYLVFSQQVGGYEITPISFVFTGIFIAIGLFKYQFFDATPAAREIVYNEVGQGVIIIDSSLTIIEANNKAFALFPQELRLGAVLDNTHTLSPLARIITEVREGSHSTFYSEETSQWIRAESFKIKPELGWTMIFFYDFTYLHDSFFILDQKKKFLQSVIDFLVDPTYVISEDGKVFVWNEAMHQLTKVTKSELIGKHIPEKLHAFIVKSNKGEIELEGKIFSFEKRPLTQKGDDIGNLVYFREITESKQMSVQLQKRVDTLENLHSIMDRREARLAQARKKGHHTSVTVAVPWHKTTK